jgi:hypothetical protein
VARSDAGRAAPRGWCDLLESRCWSGLPPVVGTTPAAPFGRGFPSLAKEGSFIAGFRDTT